MGEGGCTHMRILWACAEDVMQKFEMGALLFCVCWFSTKHCAHMNSACGLSGDLAGPINCANMDARCQCWVGNEIIRASGFKHS